MLSRLLLTRLSAELAVDAGDFDVPVYGVEVALELFGEAQPLPDTEQRNHRFLQFMGDARLGPQDRFLKDSIGIGPSEDCKELIDNILDMQRGLNAGESRTEEWGKVENGPRLRLAGSGW